MQQQPMQQQPMQQQPMQRPQQQPMQRPQQQQQRSNAPRRQNTTRRTSRGYMPLPTRNAAVAEREAVEVGQQGARAAEFEELGVGALAVGGVAAEAL